MLVDTSHSTLSPNDFLTSHRWILTYNKHDYLKSHSFSMSSSHLLIFTYFYLLTFSFTLLHYTLHSYWVPNYSWVYINTLWQKSYDCSHVVYFFQLNFTTFLHNYIGHLDLKEFLSSAFEIWIQMYVELQLWVVTVTATSTSTWKTHLKNRVLHIKSSFCHFGLFFDSFQVTQSHRSLNSRTLRLLYFTDVFCRICGPWIGVGLIPES